MGMRRGGLQGLAIAVVATLGAGACSGPEPGHAPTRSVRQETSTTADPGTTSAELVESVDPVLAWHDAGARPGAQGAATVDAGGRLVSYTVVTGDYLGALAQRFGVSEASFVVAQAELGRTHGEDLVIFEGEVFTAPPQGVLPDAPAAG